MLLVSAVGIVIFGVIDGVLSFRRMQREVSREFQTIWGFLAQVAALLFFTGLFFIDYPHQELVRSIVLAACILGLAYSLFAAYKSVYRRTVEGGAPKEQK